MSNISATFAALKQKKQRAFIPFITLGYPNVEESINIVKAMAESGADMIELGIPFSDPLADGPVIQECSQIALNNGMTLRKAVEIVKGLRRDGVSLPLLFMGYANPFLQYGLKPLFEDLGTANIDGLIIPDLPPNEATPWLEITKSFGVDLIFFLAPTTPETRMNQVVTAASGFIYCVSLNGLTGARSELNQELPAFLTKVRSHTDLPLAVGFGISTPEQIKELVPVADGMIVASAILKQIASAAPTDRISLVRNLVREFKSQTHGQ
jgi:tryptophan synthase alpha chain